MQEFSTILLCGKQIVRYPRAQRGSGVLPDLTKTTYFPLESNTVSHSDTPYYMEDDGFTIVSRKLPLKEKPSKSRRRSRRSKLQVQKVSKDMIIEDVQSYMDRILMDHADYCDQCVATLKNVLAKHANGVLENEPVITQIFCYGLGQFSKSHIARMQLALMLLIRRKLAIDKDMVVCEPILTPPEIDALPHYNCQFRQSDDANNHVDNGYALFFMPHCPKKLYLNVLKANWAQECLDRVILLGNSFDGYEERDISSNSGSYIHAIHPYSHECSISPDDRDLYPSYSDLSVHIFPKWMTSDMIWEHMECEKSDEVL